MGEHMPELSIDKLNESMTMRIPEVTKNLLEKLSPSQKKNLQEDILLTIARHLHNASFDPSLYLSTKTSTGTL